MKTKRRKKLGISMKGGGARCAAYIGFFKVLEENDIIPDFLLGSSGGSIVSGSYAAGVSLEQIENHFEEFHPKDYMSLHAILNADLIDIDKEINYAKKLVGNKTFEDTKIPIWFQVTNIKTGQPEYLNNGELAIAAIASAAVPFIAESVNIGDNHYMDGDLSHGYGVEFLKTKGADIVIAFETSDKTYDSQGLIARFKDPLQIAMHRIKYLTSQMNPPDLLIEGFGQGVSLYDFSMTKVLVDEGYNMGLEYLPKVQELIAD